jgi:hypothetical protein
LLRALGEKMFEGSGGPGEVRRYKVPGSRMVTKGILGTPERPLFTPRPRNPHPVTRVVDGHMLKVQVEEVSRGRFRELGIHPRYFRAGLKVYYLDEQEAAAFWQAKEFSTGVNAYYIVRERAVVMPPQIRNQGTLGHEVLHDVYYAVLQVGERDGFNRSLAVWVSRAITRRGNSKLTRRAEALFYQAVEQRLKARLNLALTPEDVSAIAGGIKLKGPALNFAAEAFAYGGTLHLGYWYGPEFGTLPGEMAEFFQKMQLAA